MLPAAFTPQILAAMVKTYAAASGYDPAKFAGHSLRGGFLTSAADSAASIFKMLEVSRRKSIDTPQCYVPRVDLFKAHADTGFL